MAPRDPADPFELRTLVCHDPATGERLGLASIPSGDERRSMVARATRAQRGWAGTSASVRQRFAMAVVDGIVDRLDELCRLVTHGTGKTMVDALLGELVPTCCALSRARARTPSRPLRANIVAALASSRHPLHDAIVPAVRALLDGHAVALVPEAATAWSCLAFADLVRDALRSVDADPDLVAVLPGAVADQLHALRIETTYEIERHPCALIVPHADDMSAAVDAAMLATFTPFAGAVSNIAAVLVESASYRRFVDEVRPRVAAMRVGSPLDAVDCGAVGSATCQRLQAAIERAEQHGASVRTGGRRLDHLGEGFFSPTLVEAGDLEDALSMWRIGGPVMHAIEVADEKAAPKLAAQHGADAIVWTRSPSGERSTLGLSALLPPSLETATRRSVGPQPTEQALLPIVSPYPVDARTYERLERIVRLTYGRGVRRRVRAVYDLSRGWWGGRRPPD